MKGNFETLNNEQKLAVKHSRGPCLILAGPGTGKTTIIVERTLNLIKNNNVEPHNILVITFTKAAAKEMESRFSKLKDYSRKYSQVTFGTFHSVFYKILQHYKNYRIEDLINEKDRYNFIKTIAKGSGIGFLNDEDDLEGLINEFSYVKYMLLTKRDFKSKYCNNELFWNLYDRYENYKVEQNKFDFEDMINHCYDLIKNNNKILNELRIRYKYILIDEFQDINKSQFETISLIAKPLNNIFVVGDDDQSIYKFRGSDPNIMKRFESNFKNTKIIALKDNYRNNKTILHLATNLIKSNTNRYKKNLFAIRNFESSPSIIKVEDSISEAKSIKEKIKHLISKGLRYSDIAVIYRTKVQSATIIDCFVNSRIPYICFEGTSYIHNHWIYKDIISYLKASQSIDRNNSIYRIINKPFRHIERHTIADTIIYKENFLESLINNKKLSVQQKNYLKKLDKDLKHISTIKLNQAVFYIRKQIGYEEYIKEFAELKNIDLKPLMDILENISGSITNFNSICEYINHIDLVLKKNKSSSSSSVKIMTMHKAKGLEFKAVFIIGAIEGLIPNHVYEKDKIDISDLEEERRLFYVAMTRAADDLFIYVPKYNYRRKVRPSRFLNEMYE